MDFVTKAGFLFLSTLATLTLSSPVNIDKEKVTGKTPLEAYYYKKFGDIQDPFTQMYPRPGTPSETWSCDQIRTVPHNLRGKHRFGLRGINHFYKKYTEAYGIPILGSHRVSDDALKRACYVVRFLYADNADLRKEFYKSYGHVAIMATSEVTTDIPEHRHLPAEYNTIRGLGAVAIAPVVTAGEENVLCSWDHDVNEREDILLREMAHGMYLLGAKRLWKPKGYRHQLETAYKTAIDSRKWKNTYAAHTVDSYFAEGVQSFLDANGYASPADGVHNENDNAVRLSAYDPVLYNLVRQLFPCGNYYLKRCVKDRARQRESLQPLKMNCGQQFWKTPKHFYN